MNRRVTMGDIGRQAGVHKTTVSLAMRNHPSIPETTRRRIRAVADTMGYRPDPALRALADHRNGKVQVGPRGTLAYLTTGRSRWAWRADGAAQRTYAGAVRGAEQLGFKLECFWLDEPGMSGRRLGAILHARGIEGVVLAATDLGREVRTEDALDWSTFCGVKVGGVAGGPALPRVTHDVLFGLRLVVDQVRAQGYTGIGMIVDRDWDRRHAGAWLTGVSAEAFGWMPMSTIPVIMPAHERGLDQVREWLARHDPEVVLGRAGVIEPWLKMLGRRVPEDVAIVDLDGAETGNQYAGLRLNHEAVGATAIEVLATQLQRYQFGVPALGLTTQVEGAWHDGRSLPRIAPRLAEAAGG